MGSVHKKSGGNSPQVKYRSGSATKVGNSPQVKYRCGSATKVGNSPRLSTGGISHKGWERSHRLNTGVGQPQRLGAIPNIVKMAFKTANI